MVASSQEFIDRLNDPEVAKFSYALRNLNMVKSLRVSTALDDQLTVEMDRCGTDSLSRRDLSRDLHVAGRSDRDAVAVTRLESHFLV